MSLSHDETRARLTMALAALDAVVIENTALTERIKDAEAKAAVLEAKVTKLEEVKPVEVKPVEEPT